MKAKILSLDGGGVRGIIPAYILSYIENEIIRITNNPDARLQDHLDFIAGTSTGSIIGGLINTKEKYTLSQIVKLYSDLSGKVFQRSFKDKLLTLWGVRRPIYDAKNIEAELALLFGETKMIDLPVPCAFTGYDMFTRKPSVYTSHDISFKYRNYYVKDIVRGSTSIPEFFKPANFVVDNESNTVVDGGLFANNPSIIAYIEANKTPLLKKKYKKINHKNTLFLSFGSGQSNLTKYDYPTIKKWGLIKWLVPILNILLQAIGEVVHYELKQIYDNNNNSSNYIRINPPIVHGNSSATDASKENLNNLLLDAQNYVNENKEFLTNIAKQLLNQ